MQGGPPTDDREAGSGRGERHPTTEKAPPADSLIHPVPLPLEPLLRPLDNSPMRRGFAGAGNVVLATVIICGIVAIAAWLGGWAGAIGAALAILAWLAGYAHGFP